MHMKNHLLQTKKKFLPGTIIFDHPFIGVHAEIPPCGSTENVDVICVKRKFEFSCDAVIEKARSQPSQRSR